MISLYISYYSISVFYYLFMLYIKNMFFLPSSKTTPVCCSCSVLRGQRTHVDEEGLAVEQVGELIEGLGHGGPPSLRDLQRAGADRLVGAILGQQDEVAVGVGLVVQEGDPTLAQLTGVVLHLNHQVWWGERGDGGGGRGGEGEEQSFCF